LESQHFLIQAVRASVILPLKSRFKKALKNCECLRKISAKAVNGTKYSLVTTPQNNDFKTAEVFKPAHLARASH
jgi:hypothetical protein